MARQAAIALVATAALLSAASCLARRDATDAPPSTDKAAPMLTIVGTVRRCEVRDISKRAGVDNRRSYLTLAVESVEPPEAMAGLRAVEEFVGAAPFDGLELPEGTRVEIKTSREGVPAAPRAIRGVRGL